MGILRVSADGGRAQVMPSRGEVNSDREAGGAKPPVLTQRAAGALFDGDHQLMEITSGDFALQAASLVSCGASPTSSLNGL